MNKVAAVLAICGSLLFGPDSSNIERNTLVFISDIHMNVDANYSWMVNHAAELAQFLEKLNNRKNVAELIILGDLVDDWVNPVKDSPQSFAEVLAALNNKTIISALQAVCANPDIKVTFVVGNHDMLSYSAENKAILTATFPGMNIIADDPGLGAYRKDDIIWAEHGHRYCLFNAPDTWSRPGGHLPMGYFISRLAASKTVSSGQMTTTPDILDQFIKAETSNGVFDDLIIIAVYNGIALWSGINPVEDKFFMDAKDDYIPDPFVEDIATTYSTIFSNWPSRQDRVSNIEALWSDVGYLNNAANLLFEMPDNLNDKYPFTPRIILFGHTHQAAFQYHVAEEDSIYVNTGTWIDSKPMTWAEIEINATTNGRTYQVSLWFLGETSPRQKGSIRSTAPM